MLHSGSRNIGKTLAEVHMARARTLKHNRALADPDLAVFLAAPRRWPPTAGTSSGRSGTPCSTAG